MNRIHQPARRIAALVVAVTMVAACASDSDGSSATTDAASSEAPSSNETLPGNDAPLPVDARLRVEDRLLVDTSGEPVLLLGSTLYAFPFYLTDGWIDWPVMVESRRNVEHLDEILDRMTDVGFDTIRVPLGTDAWQQNIYALTRAEWLDRIEMIVAEASERGIHVVFTWWDALVTGSEWPQRYEESFEFMRAVNERVGDHPYVMFEPMNEPREITWEQWIEATSATVRFWREELGYDGVLVLDTIDWSWSFDPDAADELLELDADMLGQPNLLFAIHRYANESTCFCDSEIDTWESTVGQYISEYPIIVTEVGNVNEGFPPQAQWVDQFVDHLVTDGVSSGLNGVLAFTWHWQDENTMTEPDGVTLTPFGTQIIDLMVSGSDEP